MTAALWVFAAHAVFAENYFVTGDTTPIENQPVTGFVEVVRLGWFGVDAFFVISGIVIARTALGRTAPDFLVARFSRIAPSFVVGVTIAVLVAFCLGGDGTAPNNGHASLPDLLPSLTLLNFPLGDPVSAEPSYWTLWIEAKFYVLVAICLLVCRVGSRRSLVIFLGLWTFAVAITREAGEPALDALLLVPFAPYFILGASVGLIRNRRELLVLSPLVAVSLTLAARTAEARGAFTTWTWTVCVLVLALLIGIGLLVPGSDSRLSRILTTLGLASFPLYLLNLRFGGLVVGALESRGVIVPVAVSAGAVLLLVLACWWAVRVEPRLQRTVRTTMTRGLRELGEPGLPPRSGGASTPPASVGGAGAVPDAVEPLVPRVRRAPARTAAADG